jgi:type II secretory pathway pseudopilin PulG
MTPFAHRRRVRNSESGYALIMIMFFLALLVLSTVVAAPTVLSSIQRERETEMVWRGQQYIRGIRLYYYKLHRFPTSMDDLTKPKTGIRFMRQAYKDPMNQVDGSWRLIYVGPNGALLGSLKDRNINVNGQSGAQFPGGMQAGSGNSAFSNSGFGNSNSLNSSGTAQGGAMGTALQNTSDNPDSSNDPSQPHSIASSTPMDASNTIGGNIIGVGSKVDKRSFLWFEKAKNYKQFEFVWDPSKDLKMGRVSGGIGTPVQGTGGAPGTINPTPPGSNPNGNPDPNQMPPLQAPPSNQ